MRRRLLPLGVTQMDAASNIGVGAYVDGQENKSSRQQFILGDPRGGRVHSRMGRRRLHHQLCTAGYRCGRTGKSS